MTTLGADIPLAKGVLQGSFSRADSGLPVVLKDNLAYFHSNLERLINSKNNLSARSAESSVCVAWILTHVAPSALRTNALGRYLVKLATSIVVGSSGGGNATFSDTVDPRKARHGDRRASLSGWYVSADDRLDPEIEKCIVRLRILLVIDAVFSAGRHPSPTASFAYSIQVWTSELKPHLTDLVRLASPTTSKQAIELHNRIRALVGSWKEREIYDPSEYIKIREPARNANRDWLEWLKTHERESYHKLTKRTKSTSSAGKGPRLHGDPNDPWYYLPVGTMLPLIKGRRPIPTARLRPIVLPDGPIDTDLLAIVESHIESCNVISAAPKVSPYDLKTPIKLNGLGLLMTKDPVTGKHKQAETYYGYSPKFAAELKKRKKNPPAVTATMTAVSKQLFVPTAQPAAPSPPSIPQTAGFQAPPPPPMSHNSGFQPPPPPPPSTSHNPGFQPPPPPPLGFQLPPRPMDWSGPWPPPPPPPGPNGMPVPPPYMPGSRPAHGADQGYHGPGGMSFDGNDGNFGGGRGDFGRGGYGGGRGQQWGGNGGGRWGS